MAEVTGELGGQPIILENAATETTLQLLLQATLANSPNKGKAAQIQKLYEEAVSKTTSAKAKEIRALQEEEKRREDLNKALDKEKERREKIVDDLKAFGEVLGKGVSAAFATAAPKITDFTDALNIIPIVGPIFSALGRASQGQVDAFRQLTSTGADLGGSINDVRRSAAQAGLALDDYVSVITQNSSTFARLTGDVATGARVFREVSGAVQGNFGTQLANLGITMGEASEFTAGYMEMQTKLGRAQKMSQTELIEGSYSYMLELDQLTRLTGMSRKEAQDALKQQQMDKRARSVMAGMDERTRKEYQKTLATLEKENPQLAEVFKEFVATGGNPVTELGKRIALANQDFARSAGQFKFNRGSFEELAGTVRKGAVEFNNLPQGLRETLSTLNALDKAMGTGIEEFAGMSEFGRGAAKVNEDQKKAAEAAGRSMASLDRVILNIRNRFMQALGPALQYFESGTSRFLTDINNYIERFAKWITELIATTEDKGLSVALGKMFSDILVNIIPFIGEAMFAMFTNPMVLLALSAAIGTAFFVASASAKAGSALAGGAGNLLGRVLSGGDDDDRSAGGRRTQPRDARGRFTRAPQPGASLAGGLSEGLLSGIAKGLSAFANPKILLGATIFSGSIAIIGAGIAAASWLMGKALPTLAEGMKSLEQLDGEKLQQAGLGIASVGAGLLVFGSSSALGSLGSVFSSIVDGVAGFFGAKSPIEKLKEFAVVGNDLGKAAEGYKEFKMAITDMPFKNLTFTDKQLENLQIGTNRLRQLNSTLSSVKDEIKSISSPSIAETAANAIKSVGEAAVRALGGKASDKATVETLMTDLNSKVDLLNSNMAALVSINQNMAPDVRKTARHTKAASGVV